MLPSNIDPLHFLGFLLGFIIGTTFHEFMHAYTALRLGDDTAQRMGRITLNPAAHFDPLGFFMMVLLALGFPLIAWGRPVQVNPYALRGGRRGMALVAIAGPIANLVFAAALDIPYRFGGNTLPTDVRGIIGYMILVNILLFSFNLIPIPPLDGFNILSGILPNQWVSIMQPIYRYSVPILLGLVFLVPYLGNALRIDLNPVGEILGPIQVLLARLFGLGQL